MFNQPTQQQQQVVRPSVFAYPTVQVQFQDIIPYSQSYINAIQQVCQETIPQNDMQFVALSQDQFNQFFPCSNTAQKLLAEGFGAFYDSHTVQRQPVYEYSTSNSPGTSFPSNSRSGSSYAANSRSGSVDSGHSGSFSGNSNSEDISRAATPEYTHTSMPKSSQRHRRRWSSNQGKKHKIQNLHKRCLVKLNSQGKLVHRTKMLRGEDVIEIAVKDPNWMRYICDFIDMIMGYVKHASCLEQHNNGVICHFQLKNSEDLCKIQSLFRNFNERLIHSGSIRRSRRGETKPKLAGLKEPKWHAVRNVEFKVDGDTERNAKELQQKWPMGKRELEMLNSQNAAGSLRSEIDENLRRIYAEKLPVNKKRCQKGWKNVYKSIFKPNPSYSRNDYINYVFEKYIKKKL
eukprot:UN24559